MEKDHYVRYGFADTGHELAGPMTKAEADELVSRIFTSPGIRITVMKVTEEYGGHESTGA